MMPQKRKEVRKMHFKTTIEVWRKGELYVASCPELDFVAQGCSV